MTSTSSSNETNDFPCKICYEQFSRKWRIPVSLHCGHTICRVCVWKLASQSGSRIQCCFCRKNTYSHWAKLGKNIAFCEMLESAKLLENDENRKPTVDEKAAADFGFSESYDTEFINRTNIHEFMDELFFLQEQTQQTATGFDRRNLLGQIKVLSEECFKMEQEMNGTLEVFGEMCEKLARLRTRISQLNEDTDRDDDVHLVEQIQSRLTAIQQEINYDGAWEAANRPYEEEEQEEIEVSNDEEIGLELEDWNGIRNGNSQVAHLQRVFASSPEEPPAAEEEDVEVLEQAQEEVQRILSPNPMDGTTSSATAPAGNGNGSGWLEAHYGDVTLASGGGGTFARPSAGQQQRAGRNDEMPRLSGTNSTSQAQHAANADAQHSEFDCRCRVPWHRHNTSTNSNSRQLAALPNAANQHRRNIANYWASLDSAPTNGWGDDANAVVAVGQNERGEHDFDQNVRFLNTAAHGGGVTMRRRRRFRQRGPRVRKSPQRIDLTIFAEEYRPQYIDIQWDSSDGWTDYEGRENETGEGTSAGSNSSSADRRSQRGNTEAEMKQLAQNNSSSVEPFLDTTLQNADNSDTVSIFSFGNVEENAATATNEEKNGGKEL